MNSVRSMAAWVNERVLRPLFGRPKQQSIDNLLYQLTDLQSKKLDHYAMLRITTEGAFATAIEPILSFDTSLFAAAKAYLAISKENGTLEQKLNAVERNMRQARTQFENLGFSIDESQQVLPNITDTMRGRIDCLVESLRSAIFDATKRPVHTVKWQ